jgi:hypothetical protein
MKFLRGKISDRIRSGELPPDVKHKYVRAPEKPAADNVRHGSGRGLGKGATRQRGSGDEGS